MEKALRLSLRMGLILSLVLVPACAVLMTLGDDEAWLLSGVQGLVERGEYSHPSMRAVVTTGGVYTAAESLTYFLFGNSVLALRLFPMACFFLILLLVFVWCRGSYPSIDGGLLSLTVLFAVPGSSNLAASAFGAVPATLLVLLGCGFSVRQRPRRFWWSCGSGLMFGLATATRVGCAVVFPALLLCAITRLRRNRDEALHFALVFLVGLVVFAVCFSGLITLVPEDFDRTLSNFLHTAGPWDISEEFPSVLNRWLIANAFLPFPLLLLATIIGAWLVRKNSSPSRLSCLGLCLCFAWLLWLTWVWKTPHPHLRYLWPALAIFAIGLGLGLAALYSFGLREDRPWARQAALSLGLACLVMGGVNTVRGLALGSQNQLIWEWRERVPILPFEAFRQRRDQQDMADYLGKLPPQEKIGCLDFGLELEFLSGRRLPRLIRWPARGLPQKLLVTEHLGQRVHLDPRVYVWLEECCDLEVRFGPHGLYRVVGPYPSDLDFFKVRKRPYSPTQRSRLYR